MTASASDESPKYIPGDESDRDAAFRNHVANTILRYATRGGQIALPEAYRQVMAATGRSLGTVKNWLAYRANFPDVASLARIMRHFSISPEEFFPIDADLMLSGDDIAPATASEVAVATALEASILSLYRPGDTQVADLALLKYTDQPRSAVFYRQPGGDLLDHVRPGELLLVDPTCEQVRDNGLYLLRFRVIGQPDRTVVRFVEVMLSAPAVKIGGGGSTIETIPFVDGSLPEHISVLARVIGILKQV